MVTKSLAVLMCKMSDIPDEPVDQVTLEGLFTNVPFRWREPLAITPPGAIPPDAPIASVVLSATDYSLFWCGHGNIWAVSWIGGAWQAPLQLTADGTSPDGTVIAALTRTAHHIDLFWVAADGSVRSTWWDSASNAGKWNTPFTIAPAGSAVSGCGIAAVARVIGRIDVFWPSAQGEISNAWCNVFANRAIWNPSSAIVPAQAAQTLSRVTAVARTPNNLDVFWVAPSNAVASVAWTGTWGTSFEVTGPESTTATALGTALARSATHLDLFWISLSGDVTTCFWDAEVANGKWNPPTPISGDDRSAYDIAPAVVSGDPTHMDVFWTGSDGQVWSVSWIPFANRGSWNAPFLIGSGTTYSVTAVCPTSAEFAVFWPTSASTIMSTAWPVSAPDGVAAYWQDISYGNVTLSGSQVFPWRTLDITAADFEKLPNRQAKVARCQSGFADVDLSGFTNIVAVVNKPNGDADSSPPVILLLANVLGASHCSHEVGHLLGFGHSYDDTSTDYAPPWGKPGEYGDGYCIMSALTYGGNNPTFAGTYGTTGPGLCAAYRAAQGWIPLNRVAVMTSGDPITTVQVASLGHPEATGALMIKVIRDWKDPTDYYTVEFRSADAWDRGIGGSKLVIQHVTNGVARFLRTEGGAIPVGKAFTVTDLSLNFEALDASGLSATVWIDP